MNIIENLFKKKDRAEILKWTVLNLEKLETKEEKRFPGEKEYIIGLNRKVIGRKKLSNKELLTFTDDLKTSLNAGLTILESLEISIANSENDEILLRSQEIKENLKRGENLTSSWKKAFSDEDGEIINIISLYEESGAIEQGFEKLSSYLKEKITYRKKVFEAMYYPAFVFVLASGVFIWFINLFIPSMMLMLKDILNQTDYLKIEIIYQRIKMVVNGFAIFASIFTVTFLTSKEIRKKVLSKLSIFKSFQKIINIYYQEVFTYKFNHLIKGGFSIIRTLDILKNDESLSFCKEETSKCIKKMLEGHPLSEGMRFYSFMEKKEIEQIRKGEIRGTLPEAFYYIHIQAQKKKSFYFNEILSFGEPFMILGSGIVVGLSVYLFYKILFSYTFTLI